MSDNLTADQRAFAMRQVKGKDTTPEKLVRSVLHRHGFRFRLHVRDLPGVPDIVLPKYRAVVFVNGCFWHQHAGCRKATIPANNRAYWARKLARTQERDIRVAGELQALGWNVVVVWECEIDKKAQDVLAESLAQKIVAPRLPVP